LIAYTNAVTVGESALSPPAAEHAALLAFRASYRASFKNKPIGEGGVELEWEDGIYRARYWMTANRGMAGAVGARFEEEGRFTVTGHDFAPLDFRHDSKAFLSRDRWQATFAQPPAAIAGEYNGKAFRFEQPGAVLDPLTQIFDSADKSAGGLTKWGGTALVKNELREYFFTAEAPVALVTPCAMFRARRIHRTREASNAARDIWQSPYFHFVPLRIDTIQRDGDVLRLELARLERAGKIVCDAARRPDI